MYTVVQYLIDYVIVTCTYSFIIKCAALMVAVFALVGDVIRLASHVVLLAIERRVSLRSSRDECHT